MKVGTTLTTSRIKLRHWTLSKEDRDFFYEIHSDETVRQFYPQRLTREQSDERLQTLVTTPRQSDLKWCVACLRDTGEPLGFTGICAVTFDIGFTPAIEIGWMYAKRHWGKGYATEAAIELLRHSFEDLHLDEIVAFAVHNNSDSIKVMKRLGMLHDPGGGFDHPNVPTQMPELLPHVLYRMSKSQWLTQKGL